MRLDVASDPKVSIIVPVYGAEKYLKRCIDSILGQTYKNWELLLIDDGSLDSSGIICDNYSIKDERIKVYHKENGGVSSARNAGLDYSTGQWIMFVDADDWLNKETLQTCLNNAVDTEFVRFGINIIDRKSCLIANNFIKASWSYDEYFAKVIGRKTIVSVWGGLYKRCLFNNLRFNTAYAIGEDWLVLYSLLKKISEIKLIERPMYNYNIMNSKSAIHTFTFNKAIQLIEVASFICQDAYRKQNTVISREISDCKCDISVNCLAGLLLKNVKMRTLKDVLIMLKKHLFYPSFHEIFESSQPLKFKILLQAFNFIVKLV